MPGMEYLIVRPSDSTGSGIEVVITGLTRNRVGQADGQRRKALVSLSFLKYLRFSTVLYLRIFYVFYAGPEYRGGRAKRWE